MVFPLYVLCILLVSARAASAEGLSISRLKGESGTHYSYFRKNDLAVGWGVKRPDRGDKAVMLSIPAAFTTTSGGVVGIYAINGKVHNRRAISKPIGGSLIIEDGDFKIFPTKKGAVFSDAFVSSLKKRRATLFQQFQIVVDGTPASFKDKKRYQMRALVQFKAKTDKGVIESKEEISFLTFNRDLAGLGVVNALYTDMGAWDEGWYRDPQNGRIVTIGNDRSATEKQSNWLYFYK